MNDTEKPMCLYYCRQTEMSPLEIQELKMRVESACKELILKGFKPIVDGYSLKLQVWNVGLTESYDMYISEAELDFQANEYHGRLEEANHLMKTEYGIND